MKTIKIKANLTKEQEAFEIAKQILKNPILIGTNNEILLIGDNEIEIQNLKSIIEIERVPNEPLMIICSCCDINFEKNTGSKIKVNYGGLVKQLEYCSEKCRSVLVEILPENRYTINNRKQLKSANLY